MRHYCPLCKAFPRPVERWEGKRCPECYGVLLEWWEPEMIETETKKETESWMKKVLDFMRTFRLLSAK